MKRNIGLTDTIIRVLIAVVIVALFLTSVINGTLGIVLLVVAGAFMLTALFGIEPMYLPFRFSTHYVVVEKKP